MMLWWRNFDIKITPERLAGRAAGGPASHPLAAFGTLQFDALEVISTGVNIKSTNIKIKIDS